MRNRKQLSRSVQLRQIALARGATMLGAAVAIIAGTTATSLAIQPSQWSQNNEADFANGAVQNVIVTNLGDVKLSRDVAELAALEPLARIVYDIQEMPDGDLYIAVGAEGKLVHFQDGEATVVAEFSGEQVFALDIDHEGRLLVALSGRTSRVARWDGEALTTLIELPTVRYIWDMAYFDGHLALATGTYGQLLLVDLAEAQRLGPAAPAVEDADDADDHDNDNGNGNGNGPADIHEPEGDPTPTHPAVTVLLDAAQPNLLCLGRDAEGRLYVGSDMDGLIYRVTLDRDRQASETFVLYDAPEPEIGALLVQADGTVYAGTADANQARPGRLEAAAAQDTGRPEAMSEAPPAVEAPDQQPPADPAPPQPDDIPGVPPAPEPTDQQEGPAADTTAQPAGDGEASADAGAPSPEQREALREVIRARLVQARDAGRMQQMQPSVPSRPAQPVRPRPAGSAGGPGASQSGNAIYRITPDLFVTQVFRESVMILRIVADDGKLIVATGNEGQIFSVDPAADEMTILAKLDVQQVPAMLLSQDGQVLLGTANPASLSRLEAGYAASGTYTSEAFDASQISLWGMIDIIGQIPDDTQISVQTRSGNVADPDKAAWSTWSAPHGLSHDPDIDKATPRQARVMSPPARFLQYRLTLEGQVESTPVIDRVQIAYLVPNLRPQVRSIQAQYPDTPGHGGAAGTSRPPARPRPGGDQQTADPEPQPTLTINWEASDPNNDALIYTLHFQRIGDDKWIELAKDLTSNSYEWATRRAPDGRYRVRVTASDAPSNPTGMEMTNSRISDPILIDNTPPRFRDLTVEQAQAGGPVVIHGLAEDELSPIRSVHYTVDSDRQWNLILPDDWIYDSTSESFQIRLVDLSVGAHIVTLRTIDGRGNARYESLRLEVK